MDAGSAKSSTVSAYGSVRANWPISKVRRLYNSVRSPLQRRHTSYGSTKLRGILMGHRKQWDRMVADISELIRLTPDDATAYYHRGQAYGEQDKWDEAVVDICEAIRLYPDNADAYRVRGDCLRYKGEYDKAIADFDTALQLDTENAAAHLGRGAAYRMKGTLT